MAAVAAFDADETLFEGFSLFPMYQALADDGFITPADNARVQEVFAQYTAGEVDYRRFVVDTLHTAALAVKGRRETAAEYLARDFYSGYPWYGYVLPTLDELRRTDHDVALITAEPGFIATGIADALGIQKSFSTLFGLEPDGTFDGQVVLPLGSDQKQEVVRNLDQHGSLAYAFGDSEGDIGMLEHAATAYCILPTPGLRAIAEAKGWHIVTEPNRHLSLV